MAKYAGRARRQPIRPTDGDGAPEQTARRRKAPAAPRAKSPASKGSPPPPLVQSIEIFGHKTIIDPRWGKLL